MRTEITLPAPAKLNLFLHITGRRTDGYHNLQTLFCLLDWCDTLHFRVCADGHIGLQNQLSGVTEEEHLCVRAAKLLQEYSGCRQGVSIGVDKQIPIGGGLGGGSSDAATTLLALNHLWELRLAIEQLSELGAQIGADVAVFVQGSAAWAEGRGELLSPFVLPQQWYLVIFPDCGVSTAEIFSHPDLTRDCAAIKIDQFTVGEGTNVCTPVVTQLYPEVAACLEWCGQYATACLSGTGSCVFAAFAEREQAEEVYAKVPAQWQARVCCGLAHSPLHTQLDQLDKLNRLSDGV